MAPNPLTQRELGSDESKESISTNANQELPVEVKKLPALDVNEPYKLGKTMSWIVGVSSLLIYAYAFYILWQEYDTIFFRKESSPHKTRNLLLVWGPIYLSVMMMEVFIGYFKKLDIYEFNDTLGSVAVYTLRIVVNRLFAVNFFAYGLYGFIWETWGRDIHQAVFPMWLQDSSAMQFGIMLFMDEFFYYWVHRTGHTFNVLWAIHQAHHGGEYYNLGQALRHNLITVFLTIFYYLPLACFFDPPVFMIMRQFNLVYQFWLHTELVGKLGWLEHILNTPSQHRVHHGRNKYCIDKNFGGMTCIFDKLFNTYQEELDDVPVVYGLTSPNQTVDSWELCLRNFKALWYTLKPLSWKDKALCVWNSPAWIPGTHPYQEYQVPPITRNTFQRFCPKLPGIIKILIFTQTVFVMVIFNVINRRWNNEPHLYWYFYGLCIFLVYVLYGVSAVGNRKHNAGMIQLGVFLGGAFLFCVNSFMKYSDDILLFFGKFLLECAFYFTIGFALTALVWYYKQAIEMPLTDKEIGKDLEFAEEAEKAQWEHYHKRQQEQKSKKEKLM